MASPNRAGQPGQQNGGQPGDPAGSQQLSDAAQALADAASQALPDQFNPNQMQDGESSAEGRDAMGNASLWDGLLPDRAGGPAGSRDWGKLTEVLESETAEREGVSRDSEYESLIRMYFREVARAAAADD